MDKELYRLRKKAVKDAQKAYGLTMDQAARVVGRSLKLIEADIRSGKLSVTPNEGPTDAAVS